MWQFLRRKLWTYEIATFIHQLEEQVVDLKAYHSSMAHQINTIDGRLRVQNEALGKILAQLQPMLGKSEFDPAREAESDRLAEETIKRLEAEDWARRHTEGKC
jgi:hypothetical protein